MKFLLSLAVLILSGSYFFPNAARAVESQEITYDHYDDFATGTAQSVTLSDLGVLAPAPALDSLAALDADQIWALAPGEGNALYAATSPKGELFRIAADGKVEVAAKFPETHLYALARNAHGELFVGSSPDGKIYKVTGPGKFEVYFDPKAKYIWALLFDKKGDLYAATGTEGKIFKITGPNKGDVFCATDETHIRSLAFDAEGALLAGSAPTGLLYRIGSDGKAIALASTGRQEIDRIAVAPNGVIYFSATGVAHPPVHGASNKIELPAQTGNEANGANAANKPILILPTLTNLQMPEPNTSSQVWRLDASLCPQPIWTTPETIFTLDIDGPGVRVGTGGEGYLYRLDARGHATRVLKLEGPSITATAPAIGDHFYLASSNPAKVYRVGGPRHEPGIYESEAVDSHGFAKWGAVRAEGTGTFDISTRSGNTPEPDKSWYPWTPLKDDHSQSPDARYFQYRIALSSGTIDHAELAYLPKNLPPHIEEIQILSPGVGYIAVAPAPPIPQPKSAEQVLQSANGESTVTPKTHYQPVASRGYRTAVWKAIDPNDDTLHYTLSYRSANESEWRVLAKDLTDPVFSWDCSGWPDGRYYLKVTATDEADNLPGQGLTDEIVSRLFLVDNTPPVIKVTSGQSHDVAFTVTDEASGIDTISVSKDGNEFKDLQPSDGVLDPRREAFTYKLETGEILFIRAQDQAGNVSGAQVKP